MAFPRCFLKCVFLTYIGSAAAFVPVFNPDGLPLSAQGSPENTTEVEFTAPAAEVVPRATWNHKATYDHTNFFNDFSFFTGADPTHGYVNYLDKSAARSSGLIKITHNQVYLGVDYKTRNPSAGRASVRLSSKRTWTHGLFIADIVHMPAPVCGTWPAFWLFGPNWPNSGEIDIIEGVSQQNTNAVTLHTSPGCNIKTGNQQSATRLIHSNCNEGNAGLGCGVTTTNTKNYGSGFNADGGGVYAMEWLSSSITVWFLPRKAITSDIKSGNPNPNNWGKPIVRFQGGSGCNIDSHFRDHQIIFDTTFCGDWAGGVWGNGGCAKLANTCQEYVGGNPGAFERAFWLINSVKVYQ